MREICNQISGFCVNEVEFLIAAYKLKIFKATPHNRDAMKYGKILA